MLKIIIREAKLAGALAQYPQVYLQRASVWKGLVHPPNSVRLVQKDWAKSLLWFSKNDLDLHQNTSQVVDVIDIEKSKGNYIVDADGNTMLDLCSADVNPLGYNHDLYKDLISGSKETDAAIINHFSTSVTASEGFGELVQETMDKVAPVKGMGVTLVDSQNATAAAVKDAMLQRSGAGHGHSALYFDGSTHGSPLTLGGMICGWPKVSYPASAEEESKVLENVRSVMGEKSGSDSPIAAIVIEPTQQSTGLKASDNFISTLKSIAADFDAALVVDETSTGCGASGKGFWQYNGPADYVAFGKRTQVTGFFSQTPGVNLGGCESDLTLFKAIYQGILEDQLLAKAEKMSSVVASKASQLSVAGVTSAKTSGTSLWLETDSADTASKLVTHLRDNGVLVQRNGATSVAAHPSLYFSEAQATELFGALAKFQ